MLGIPVWAWLVVLVASLGLSSVHYFRRLKSSKSGIWWLAFSLRSIGYGSLLLLLFNPWWQWRKEKVESPVLLVYEDKSASIDSLSAQKWKRLSEEIASKKNMRVQYFGFAHEVFAEDSVSRAARLRTNLSAVFQHAMAKSVTSPVGGMVVVSDGIVNEGLDPLVGNLPPHIPIITVGMGNVAPRIDALAGTLLCNDEVFLGNSFVVESSIRAVRLMGETLVVRCLWGSEEVGRTLWKVSSEADWKRVNFEVKPKAVGMKRLSVVISSMPGEENLSNNIQSKYVKVVDERKRVEILFGAPHPDVSALGRALGLEGQFACVAKPKKERSETADVYVLHGWNWSDNSDVVWLNNQLKRGKAIWIFASPGMRWDVLGRAFGVDWTTSSLGWQDAQPQWNEAFSGWSPTGEESLRWGSLPPVKSPVLKLAMPEGSSAVMWQRWGGAATKLPLMTTWKMGNSGVGMFFGEGIWRWRIEDRKNDDGKVFDAWVRRMTGLLAAGSSTKKSLEISLSKQQFDLSEEVIVRVVCRDKAGENDDEVSRTLKVGKLENGVVKSMSAIALEKGKGGWRGVLAGLTEGEYQLIAEGGIERSSVSAQIALTNQPQELMDLQANHGLLKALSQRSNGGFCLLDDRKMFAQLLKEKPNQVAVMREEVSNQFWWKSFGWLLLVVLSFGGEWAVRRWMGAY